MITSAFNTIGKIDIVMMCHMMNLNILFTQYFECCAHVALCIQFSKKQLITVIHFWIITEFFMHGSFNTIWKIVIDLQERITYICTFDDDVSHVHLKIFTQYFKFLAHVHCVSNIAGKQIDYRTLQCRKILQKAHEICIKCFTLCTLAQLFELTLMYMYVGHIGLHFDNRATRTFHCLTKCPWKWLQRLHLWCKKVTFAYVFISWWSNGPENDLWVYFYFQLTKNIAWSSKFETCR